MHLALGYGLLNLNGAKYRKNGAMNSLGVGMMEILGIFVGFYTVIVLVAIWIDNHKK